MNDENIRILKLDEILENLITNQGDAWGWSELRGDKYRQALAEEKEKFAVDMFKLIERMRGGDFDR
jgi:hypothetical protein